MLSVVQGAVAYINASRDAGTPDPMVKEIVDNRVNNIITMLGKSSPTIEDCTRTIALIGRELVFDGEQKKKLLAAFHTKIQSDPQEAGDEKEGSKSQRNVFV